MIWRDDQFDYFRTSDGYLYCVLRHLKREAAEARFKRNMYWIDLMNFALTCLFCAFMFMDVVFLCLAIVFCLLNGGE